MIRAPRSSSRRQAVAGFTLIEILLATVLLAAGLALAFATLSAATQTATRGEAMAQRSERQRAVEGFMRKRLTATRPVPFGFDQASALPQRFIGDPDRMRFVADLPDYLGRGGPYVHDLSVAGGDGQRRLDIALTQVQAGKQIDEARPRPPEPLAEDLRQVRFRYRGMDPERAGLGPWQERWEHYEQLPVLVSIEITGNDGAAWPPLVVALRQAGAAEARP